MPERLVKLGILAMMLTLLLGVIACSEEPVQSDELRASPSTPPAAPSELVEKVASDPSLGGEGEENGSDETAAPTGGTQVTVLLQDPAGSGAYEFSPSSMTFAIGETVAFTLTAETEFHTFTVDDLGFDIQVNSGETATFSFVFSEPGTYELICIPHELLEMIGTITVQ